MILKFTVGEFEKILIMSLKLRILPTWLLISPQQMFFLKMMYFEDVKEANRLVLSDSESG